MTMPIRLRLRLGRWLLRPESARIIRHYTEAARSQRHTELVKAQRCDYIAIGASYVANGWPGGEGDVRKEGGNG